MLVKITTLRSAPLRPVDALGNAWILTELCKELGFSDLRRVFGRIRHTAFPICIAWC